MTHPAAYGRRILLAVTGLTPQIVTETLYALAVERKPVWVPTEIRIITTRQGAERAQNTLLSDDPGWLRRLCADYRLPEIAFGCENIRVVAGPDGTPLDDILDQADNAAVADFITEEVRALTADPNASLHISIAGGRKTMGFYVGYALSLFGRAQDRLSHVLVPPPLESKPEFFYPRPPPFPPPQSPGQAQGGEPPDARPPERAFRGLGGGGARVYLGDIPFVRLREGLPERRLFEGRARFSEIVAEAQNALPPSALHLDPATLTVIAGGQSFPLEPAQFAFYWLMAERCTAKKGGVHWSDPGIGDDLLGFCRALGEISEQTERAYGNFNEDNFDPLKTKVNQALRRALGAHRAAPYLIVRLDTIAGSRRHRFGLALLPEAVTIAASLRTPRVNAGGSTYRP
jgi:CRISPR-associated protein (TIGR02584 family)